ncbi:MAG: hypothetical protein LBI34_01865 [Puniceicoccales bacterium]|jgi:hypothetical protein|nr:hypothetical protein [Puniceicoccales bacterium]
MPDVCADIPLVRMNNQQDPKLTAKQMEERSDAGLIAGGFVGMPLMGVMISCLCSASGLTVSGILFGVGISFTALFACLIAGNTIAKNWDAILGFLGKQPTAPENSR